MKEITNWLLVLVKVLGLAAGLALQPVRPAGAQVVAQGPFSGYAGLPLPARAAAYLGPLEREIDAGVRAGNFAEAQKKIADARQQIPLLENWSSAAQILLDIARVNVERVWGNTLLQQGNLRQALVHLDQAAVWDAAGGNISSAMLDYAGAGVACSGLGQMDEGIRRYEAARAQAHLLGTNYRGFEADYLGALANLQESRGENAKAHTALNLALTIYAGLAEGNPIARTKQITTMILLAECLRGLGRTGEAQQQLRAAHPLSEKAGVAPGVQAEVLRAEGNLATDLYQNEPAFAAFEAALRLSRSAADKEQEAETLLDRGIARHIFGPVSEAISDLMQAADLFHTLSPPPFRAKELLAKATIASILVLAKRLPEAETAYRDSLTLARSLDQPYAVADVSGSLGTFLIAQGRGAEGESLCREALGIFGLSHNGERANLLLSLAAANRATGREEAARDAEHQAYWAAAVVDDRATRNIGDFKLAIQPGQPGHGTSARRIFLLKRVVHNLQQMRQGGQSLSKQTQQGFQQSFLPQIGYQGLLYCLLDDGHRLPEAIEAFTLARQEEYLRTATDTAARGTFPDPSLTPREARWNQRLNETAAALRKRLDIIRGLTGGTETAGSNAAALSSARAEYETEENAAVALFQPMEADFDGADAAGDRLARTPSSAYLQTALASADTPSAAVYEVSNGAALRIVLVTSTEMFVTDSPSCPDLDKVAVQFRTAVADPRRDPRPLGQQLYRLLIQPLEKQLSHAGVKSLWFSLEGNLRSLPLAAFSPDGTTYLAERYATRLFLPVNGEGAAAVPPARPVVWKALAGGVSHAWPGLPALPNVPAELRDCFDDPAGGAGDRIAGRVLIDAAFRPASFLSALKEHPNLIHLASHFSFAAKKEESFLLLGDGSRLTLADFEALPDDLLSGVDLVTLSACDTAVGKPERTMTELAALLNGDGASPTEPLALLRSQTTVDSFAALVRQKGAGAVLASLWPVQDASTAALMHAFYTQLRENGSGSKSEALQHAQQAMIHGRLSGATLGPVMGLVGAAAPGTVGTAAPAYKPDPARKWAHPYFWAPFVLIDGKY